MSKMLIIFTILVVTTAAILFVGLRLRQAPKLTDNNSPHNLNPANMRPLFQPTDDELRAYEREQRELEAAKTAVENRQKENEKADEILRQCREWNLAPERKSMIELLLRASECERADVFSEVSLTIVEAFRQNRLENLTSNDLADLLDSHFRTLPQQERSAGTIFRLREEIESLRARTEE